MSWKAPPASGAGTCSPCATWPCSWRAWPPGPRPSQLRLDEYRDNLSALGTWLLQTVEQPLQIDYILITSPEQELPRAEPTFWETVRHELAKLVASFTFDYSALGDLGTARAGDRTIKVWIGTGRTRPKPSRP